MFESCLYSAVTGGGVVTHAMHGRSRMSIDHRTSTMPGRSTSGFHLPGIPRILCICLSHSIAADLASAVRLASSDTINVLHVSVNRYLSTTVG